MANKQITPEGLYKDLGHVLHGFDVMTFLTEIVPPLPALNILEAGCGSGKMGIYYALKCALVASWVKLEKWNVHLFDIDPAAVQYAKMLASLSFGITFAPDDVRRRLHIALDDLFTATIKDHYDLVYNEGVVQHWPDERQRQLAIDRMVLFCKPGGTVCVIGNNGLLKSEQEADQTVPFTYEGMPPTRKCFTPQELGQRLSKSGLEEVKVAPVTPSWEVPGDLAGGGLEYSSLIAGWGKKPASIS